jgi:DHA2 family multidrug resistance protein
MKAILPFAVMCVGMFIALLDIQIVASSLQDIGGGLSAAQDQISWVQTSYLIAEIIVIPLSGWLTRVFSTRWLFAGSALGFTLSSMLCGLAWNIDSMIVFRALQGLLGASMIPTVPPRCTTSKARSAFIRRPWWGPSPRSHRPWGR